MACWFTALALADGLFTPPNFLNPETAWLLYNHIKPHTIPRTLLTSFQPTQQRKYAAPNAKAVHFTNDGVADRSVLPEH